MAEREETFYDITIPSTGKKYRVGQQAYDQFSENMFRQAPDAQVTRVSLSRADDDDINERDQFQVLMDNGSYEQLTAQKYSQFKDKMWQDFPNAKVYKVSDMSWRRNEPAREEARKRLEEFDKANGEFMQRYEFADKEIGGIDPMERNPMSHPEWKFWADNSKSYNEFKKQRDALREAYYTNPNTVREMKEGAEIARVMTEDFEKKAKEATGSEKTEYERAAKLMNDVRLAYEAPGDNDPRSAWSKYWQGAGKEGGDLDNWFAGARKMFRDFDLAGIQRKIEKVNKEKGDNVTPEDYDAVITEGEKALLKAATYLAEVQAERSSSEGKLAPMSGAYTAGQGFAQSVPFMIEFLLSEGLGSAIAKGVRAVSSTGEAARLGMGVGKGLINSNRALTRWIGRNLLSENALRNATNAGLKLTRLADVVGATGKVGKALNIADDAVIRPVVKGLWHTATQPRFWTSYAENLNQVNDKGELMSGWEAFNLTFWDNLIENWSESVGAVLDKGTGRGAELILGRTGKLGSTPFGRFARWMFDNRGTKILADAGFNGLAGEMTEEWIGNAARVAFGFMSKEQFADFASLNSQLEMAASFAPMSVIGFGTSTYGAMKQKKAFNAQAELAKKYLAKYGANDDAINNIFSTRFDTAQDIARKLAPYASRMHVASEVGDKTAKEDYKNLLKLSEALGENMIVSQMQQYEKQAERSAALDEIIAAHGGNKNIIQAGATEEKNTVTRLTDVDGNSGFVLSREGDEFIVSFDGEEKPRYVREDEIATDKDGNPMVQILNANEYVDTYVAAKKNAASQQAMAQQEVENAKAVGEHLAPGSTIPMGTPEAPREGKVTRLYDDGSVDVEYTDEEGKPQADHLSIQQAADHLNMPLKAKSEEEKMAERLADDERADAKRKPLDEVLHEGLRMPIMQGYEAVKFEQPQRREGSYLYPVIVKAADTGKAALLDGRQIESDDEGVTGRIYLNEAEMDKLSASLPAGEKAARYNSLIQSGTELEVSVNTGSEDTQRMRFTHAAVEDGQIMFYGIDEAGNEISATEGMINNLNGVMEAAEKNEDAAISDSQGEEQEPEAKASPYDGYIRQNTETGESVIDSDKLWNEKPELWCEWNDTQNDDPYKVTSKEKLSAAIKKLAQSIKKNADTIRKNILESKDSKNDKLRKENAELTDRKSRLEALLEKYNAPATESKAVVGEQRQAEAKKTVETQLAGFDKIKERWESATKFYGAEDEIILPSGESVSGRYVLTDASAPTASHNPEDGFKMSEGFPVDENGKTVNDRDYEHDASAQEQVKSKADKYDQRALQNPVVVSNEGVVLSGNDRTMAGQMAARQRTDTAYNEYLANYAQKYGFTEEQVAQFEHPRVVFVPDEAMPYDAATFAKFNGVEQKAQSKTEKAVKFGKTLSEKAVNAISALIDRYEDYNAFYNDAAGVSEILDLLQKNGVITAAQRASLVDEAGRFSGEGRDLVDSVLLGAALDEEAVREVMKDAMMRASVISAIGQLLQGNSINGYSLRRELSDAILLVAEGKREKTIKHGETVQDHIRQKRVFADDVVAEATVQLLGDCINSKKTTLLKKVLSSYAGEAALADNNERDVFTGQLKSKEMILREILSGMGYNIETYDTAAGQQSNSEAGEQPEQGGSGEQTDSSVPGDAESAGRGEGGAESEEREGGISPSGDGVAEEYSVSEQTARKGGNFIQNPLGSIDLVRLAKEVLDKLNIKDLPLRLTTSMVRHIYEQHKKESGFQTEQDAIRFVVDVMTNFDHVRMGEDGAFVFSIENARADTGRRAITIILESDSGDYLGVKTAGYERLDGMKKRPLLWEKGVETSAADTASANVTSETAQQGGEPNGNASNQSEGLSEDKDSKKSSETNNPAEGFVNQAVSLAHQWAEADARIKESLYDETEEGRARRSALYDQRAGIELRLANLFAQMSEEQLTDLGASGDEFLKSRVEDFREKEKGRNKRSRIASLIAKAQRLVATKAKAISAKLNLSDFLAPKGDARVMLTGVFHDKGYAVASDAQILIADKGAYEKKNEGKTIGRDGKAVEGKYPKWRELLPDLDAMNKHRMDFGKLREFIASVRATIEQEYESRVASGEIDTKKVSKPRYVRDAMSKVMLSLGRNEVLTFKLDLLSKLADYAERIGAKEIYFSEEKKAIYIKNSKGIGMLMPVMIDTSNRSEQEAAEFLLDNYTYSFGENDYQKQQAIQEEAAAAGELTEAQKNALAFVEGKTTEQVESEEKARMEAEAKAKAERERKQKAVDDALAAWKKGIGDAFVVHTDTSTIVEPEVVDQIEKYDNEKATDGEHKEARVRGWFANGQAHIYLPHILEREDGDVVSDVNETIMHECLAHKGIRMLLKTKEAINKFFDFIWEQMEGKKWIVTGEDGQTYSYDAREYFLNYVRSTAPDMSDVDARRAAADEYFAHVAEYDESVKADMDKGFWDEVWEFIKNIFKDAAGMNIFENEPATTPYSAILRQAMALYQRQRDEADAKAREEKQQQESREDIFSFAEGEETKASATAKASENPQVPISQSQEKYEDFGEKIGMARKDTATSGFTRGDADGRPSWMKKYSTINARPLTEEEIAARDRLYGGFIRKNFEEYVGDITKGTDFSKPFVAYWDEEKKTWSGKRTIRHYITDAKRNPIIFMSQEQYEATLPVFEAARAGFAVHAYNDGKFRIDKKASNGKYVEYAEFDTREEAVAYLASPEGATELLNRKRENYELPALTELTRNGMPDYRKGRNIRPEDFQDTFGFRGGEFGNWLNAEERQQFLNYAYDALMDLASILHISPQALSLGGELSIAFGARGHQGARAHYEPTRAVINLTKMNGAGSLAHEWAHALDNYFGMMDAQQERIRDEKQGDKNDHYMSEGLSWKKGAREEVRQAVKDVMAVLTSKMEERAIVEEKEQEAMDKRRNWLQREIGFVRTRLEGGRTSYQYNRKTKKYEDVKHTMTEEQLSNFDKLVSELETDPTFKYEWDYTRTQWRGTGEVADKLRALVKDIMPDRKADNPLHDLFHQIDLTRKQAERLKAAKEGKTETLKVPTTMLESSEWFDRGRASKYYAKPLEMFARAFETYVAGEMKAGVQSSDYLTYEKSPLYMAMWGKSPYPMGAERTAAKEAFDKLFQTIQEKTDEKTGKTVLYSKKDNKGDVKSEVRMLFEDAVSGKWTGKPKSIGRITSDGKQYLESISGIEMKDDVDFVLNPSDLIHIHNEHFGTNEKDASRNIPLTIEDIQNIVDVVERPERVVYLGNDGNSGAKFAFIKASNRGAYNLIEVYGDRKGNLTAKTFYNTKRGVSQRAVTLEKESGHSTSETTGATSFDATNVPILFDISKTNTRFSRAYHGTGADFERFDHSHMGEGEGSQIYGWGTYVSTNRETGLAYARSIGGSDDQYERAIRSIENQQGRDKESLAKAKTDAERRYYEDAIALADQRKEQMKRHLYTVEIPDDNGQNYLHWDEPLTREQSRKIKAAVKERTKADGEWYEGMDEELDSVFNTDTVGAQVEGSMDYFLGDIKDYSTGKDAGAKRNAQLLRGVGIVGFEIPIDLNGGTRFEGSNYVIFDEKDLKITDHLRFSRAYHGSGNGFEFFSHQHIGEGEGAQAHGWGTYVSFQRDVAEGYATRSGRTAGYGERMAIRESINQIYNLKEEQGEKNKAAAERMMNWVKAHPEASAEEKKEHENLAQALATNDEPLYKAYDEALRVRSLLVNSMENAITYKKASIFTPVEEMEVIADATWQMNRLSSPNRQVYLDYYRDAWQAPEGSAMKKAYEFIKNTKDEDWVSSRHLYAVEVPDDNGENYLDEQGKASLTDVVEVFEELARLAEKDALVDFNLPSASEFNKEHAGATNEYLYNDVARILGSQKEASELFERLGYVGIKYDGRMDGPCAVIFKEDYIRITEHIRFSLRTKPAPEKTGIGYKVFYQKDGKLYPPMVANPNGEDTPVGVWLDADAAPVAGESKTGRQKVKAGGKGTQGGSGLLAYRPGWHLGEIPYAIQFNRFNPETGKKDLFPKDFVWAEVEYAADKDYQADAEKEGMNKNGKYQHSLAGLKRIPEDGFYRYRTNPNPETDPWIITGAMKVNRILTDEEVDDIVRAAGREPQQREGDVRYSRKVADSLVKRYDEQDGEQYPWMSEGELISAIEEELPYEKDTEDIFSLIDKYNRLDEADFDEGRRDFSGADKDSTFEDIMNALRSYAKGEEKDIRFSFIGEKGARALAEAENDSAIIDDMLTAMQMEIVGKTPEEIKIATGWEKGVDGKWRYEMPDLKVKGDIHNKIRFPETARLEDIVEDDDAYKKLVKAYPSVAAISVYSSPMLENNAIAGYNDYTDEIVFNSHRMWDFTSGELRGHLLHELQHAIQHREGFAQGASFDLLGDEFQSITQLREDAEKKKNDLLEAKKNHPVLKFMLAALKGEKLSDEDYEAGRAAMPEGRWRDSWDRLYNTPISGRIAEQTERAKEAAKEYEQRVNQYDEPLSSMRKAYIEAEKAYNEERFRIYRAHAGEVEARNVERRLPLTDEARRTTTAELTEDTPRKDQIVRFDLVDAAETYKGLQEATLFRPDTDLRFSRANENQRIFISNAEAALGRIKMDKATPEQWLKMLEKEGGLKAGEDKWLGLSDWLNASDKKTLTRDELAAFIKENQIQLEEVNYSENGDEMAIERKHPGFTRAYYLDEDEFHGTVSVGGINDLDAAIEFYNREHEDKIVVDDSEQTRMFTPGEKISNEDYDKLLDYGNKLLVETGDFGRINSTRLGYTTEGLDNKREIALVVPTIEPYNKYDKIHFGDAGEGRAIAWIRFGEANVGLNKRALVIDEIQSKRHQDGRKFGYKGDARVDEARKVLQSLMDKYEARTMRDLEASITNKTDHDTFTKNKLIVAKVVPGAPFEKNWHELAMKRMLRLAAEEGYDMVAWATGDQQAERYNIGGVVSSIERRESNNVGEMEFTINLNDNAGSQYLTTDKEGNVITTIVDDFRDKNLSDIVGKEVAQKMLGLKENESISGDGLRVGGEGMKGFYDDILPRFVNKYVKKWGASTGDILVELSNGVHLDAHSVEVTPEMKESVMQGQVMFSRKRKASETASVSSEEEHQPTVVSDASGAKVVKNLENLINHYKKVSSQSKTFIGDVAKALGAERDGSNSQYATFETVNGKIVTIRLADHNAQTSTFDNRGEADGLSIVISPKKNQKIFNDGKAHIVEFFYDAIKLRRAEGKPLADIIRSIQQSLFSGEYKDTTGLAEPQDVNGEKDEAKTLYSRSREVAREVSESGIGAYVGEQNIRGLIGDIYQALPETMRAPIVESAMSNGYDVHKAVRSYLSDLAKNGFENDETGALRMVSDMIQGYAENPEALDDPTLRYLVWKLANPSNGGLLAEATDIAMRNRFRAAQERAMFSRKSNRNASDFELNSIHEAEAAISNWLKNNTRGKAISVDLPSEVKARIDRVVGREIFDNVITANNVAHAKKEHGINGEKITENSIPLRDSDFGLMPYIMVAPDRIEKGSTDVTGRESVRFIKNLSNGIAVVVEKEQKNSPDDMETITMWAEKSSGVANASSMRRPLQSTSTPTSVPSGSAVGTVISDSDIAKIRKDAENAIKNELLSKPQSKPAKNNSIRYSLSEDLAAKKAVVDKLADAAKDNLDEKKKALKGKLLTAAKAMAIQKEYDERTVSTLSALAKALMAEPGMDRMSRLEVGRILGIVTTSVGKSPSIVKRNADALLDIMINHLLRIESENLDKLASVKATKSNAAGVEVQGALDIKGQNTIKAYKAGLLMKIGNDVDETDGNTINGRLNILAERLESNDDTVRAEAEAEYDGLVLAKEYLENIQSSKEEETGLKNEAKDAAEARRTGLMTPKQYSEFAKEVDAALRENRIERIEAYRELYVKMASVISGSRDSAAAFREREKARIEDIHHLANSDMQGVSASPFQKSTFWGRVANSSFAQFFLSPLATFAQMLRFLGRKSVSGEGYLFNRFHRGWEEASETEYLGNKEAKSALDKKVSEVFGKKMRWSDLYEEERKLPTAKVTFWDGGEMKEHELTQGNLLYIYMVNKMSDGRMKLRRMGISQEDVDAIKEQMDERFLKLADWLQDEFLVSQRNKYNAVHERVFGASMAAIDNYFPLRINKRSLNKEEDIGRPEMDDTLPATTTGSVIKRRRNSQDLDLIHADAFSVAVEHIEEMEKWAAFAEFNKDLNTLLSYKRFRNQMMNTSSVYGSGKQLWQRFKNVSRIAGGTYHPAVKAESLDAAAVNLAKGVTMAKISFRVYTALKQLLSMPAFVADANLGYLLKNMAMPKAAWEWTMENLPLAKKRWESRQAGDTRLMQTDSDWKLWRAKVVETASRLGMTPNGFVDALTVSIGAYSIYQTKLESYLKDGYAQEQAENRARQDATTLYNETQQSSEGAFVSDVQLDRTLLSTAITVFRNSSMGYQRQLHDALRGMGRLMKPGYKEESIEFMTKQMVRDGLTEEQARHAAERQYGRALAHNAVRIATFGFLVQFAWNLGSSLAYLLLGDDDDKKKEMVGEAAKKALLGGWAEGLAGGNIMSEAINMVSNGENLSNYNPTLLPILGDIKNTYRKMQYDPVAGANDILNLAIQAGIGVNPQTFTDAVVAVVDAAGGNMETSKEALMFALRVIQVPQSQLDEMLIDELGINPKSKKDMDFWDIAERYAKYKTMRNAPMTGWLYSDEAEDKRERAYLKSFKKKVKSRIELIEED